MKMNIGCLRFNPIQENTYVVWDETMECAVIDAGNSTERENDILQQFIAERGLKPVLAVNTHGHFDHVMGVEWVVKYYGVPFAMSSKDNFLIENAAVSGEIYGIKIGAMPKITVDIEGQQEIKFGNTTLRIILAPGHTPGHVCFYEPETKSLFTGDTLFRESIGRTDLPGGDYGWIMKSIIDNILPLGEEVKIYPGHGPSSTLGHEMHYNPFITEVMEGDVRPE